MQLAAIAGAATDAHVSIAAIRARNQQSMGPYWGGTNPLLRKEPTWGDVDVLALIITRLQPGNSNQLLSAFSSGSPSVKVLQAIRNCAAHNNHQTVSHLMAFAPSFQAFAFTHPTQALFWTEPASNDYLISHAIDELLDTAQFAIA